jgi:hypothetical protein
MAGTKIYDVRMASNDIMLKLNFMNMNRLQTIQRVRPVEAVVVLFSGEPIFLSFQLSSLHDV